MIWLVSLGSVVLVSLISLIGLATFRWSEDDMRPFLLVLVSFSTGAMLGDAFIHLLPEVTAEAGKLTTPLSLSILAGILVFFILEKFIHWHHCHTPQEHKTVHPFVITNLVGDGLHNFIDGLIIGASYMVSLPVGLATTIAVILHEIPQEIADFGVLIHGGLTKSKALLFNFYSATTSILGTVIVLVLGANGSFVGIKNYLLAFTAGGFIYIAATDMIPELHKETNPLSSLVQLFTFISGIAVMLTLLLLE